ncbi:MAG: nucleotidyltransferase domain-containing protein, partial [Candidatus Nanohaloarchaea archaeon]|nr:nucleotidyltransferase domain-containing protein [Candidatus Nanohaloarchaea archaeon]
MGHAEVKENVLERVEPEESEGEEAREMFERIQEFVEDEFGVEAGLMGSTAKGTFMQEDKDLDIFVFFEESVGEEELEEEGLEIGGSVFEQFDGDYEVEYAEHPYTKGEIDGYEVEIVPAYRVDSGENIKSSVDRTPFH